MKSLIVIARQRDVVLRLIEICRKRGDIATVRILEARLG
jgi:hypothetical protein